MRITIRLLGQFEVAVGGERVNGNAWRLRHPRELLQMLCLSSGGRVSRDEVLERLWPRATMEAAANRLYHTLHSLRGIFSAVGVGTHQPVLLLSGGVIQLTEQHDFEIDCHAFRASVALARAAVGDERVRALQSAVDAYTGELLAGQPCEDWIVQPREMLRHEYVWALDQLAAAQRADGQLQLAIGSYQRLIEAEPANELAHRALMELFDSTGHPERAVYQYTACKRYLQRDLDAEPSPATQALLKHVVERSRRQRDEGVLAPSVGSHGPVRVRRYRAPPHAVGLVGRAEDLDRLAHWISAEGARLVTITAVAGQGKSRVAHALAERIQDGFVDGVAAVSLTGLRSADQLAEHLLGALDVDRGKGLPVQRLRNALAERHMLLVLDRFEHLLEAAPLLGELLHATPGLTMVVTSQAPLRCLAERVYRLPSLVDAGTRAAVDLFMQVAANAGSRLDLDADGAQIEAICRRLAGNPLAIELAAGQAQALSLREIAERLDRPLELLTNPACDAEAPHRSLRDAVAWSYQLLTPAVQQTLCMLSVFRARFALQDAAAVLSRFVCADDFGRRLALLAERNLVSVQSPRGGLEPGTPVQLLDTVACFAAAQAPKLPQFASVQRAHARYFAAEARRHFDLLRAGRGPEALAFFHRARLDLSAALEWHGARASLWDRLCFTHHVGALAMAAGAFSSAVELLERSVSKLSWTSREERLPGAWCYYVLARAYSLQSQRTRAILAIRAARRLAKGCDDLALHERITMQRAVERMHQGRYRHTLLHLRALIKAGERRGDAAGLADMYCLLANVQTLQGRPSVAVATAGVAVDRALTNGDTNALGTALMVQAEGLLMAGHADRARALLDECAIVGRHVFSPLRQAQLQLLDATTALQAADWDRTGAVLARLKARLDIPDGAVLRKVVGLVEDFVRIERGDQQAVAELDAVDLRELRANAELAFLDVLTRSYRVRLFASRLQWHLALVATTDLVELLRPSQNALWHACLAESAAHLTLRRGAPRHALALAARARQFLLSNGIRIMPRQDANLRRIEAAARAERSQDPLLQLLPARADAVGRESAQEILSFVQGLLLEAPKHAAEPLALVA
jgi:predicted ATPase/DNA-binding SARP family transcriptional activator